MLQPKLQPYFIVVRNFRVALSCFYRTIHSTKSQYCTYRRSDVIDVIAL